MQASLAEVIVCVIRTEAVHRYVPLGALSGVTQPTQLSYLWSLDYVSIFTSPALSGWRKAALVCAIPVLLVLTALVGPSSAILMIPRPDTPHIIRESTLYSLKSEEDLYPEFLNKSNGLTM
jgi:hypothetical protein